MKVCDWVDERTWMRVQELMFWYRPISSAFALICVNLFLIAAHVMHLDFVSGALLLMCVNNLRFAVPKETMDFFFEPETGEEERKKLISMDELRKFEDEIKQCFSEKIGKWIDSYMRYSDVWKHTAFFLIAMAAFLVTVVYSEILTAFLIGNGLFVVPFIIFKKRNMKK